MLADLIAVTGSASTRLEKYSMATTAKRKPPGAVGSGPTMLMPHHASSQTGANGWSSVTGRGFILLILW